MTIIRFHCGGTFGGIGYVLLYVLTQFASRCMTSRLISSVINVLRVASVYSMSH